LDHRAQLGQLLDAELHRTGLRRVAFASALDAGDGSHEAFTRALREQFALTPENIRDRRSTDGLALVGPPELKAKADERLEPPRLVDADCLRVVGLSEPCSFETTNF
jgi:AraC family transcriptional regulator